MTTCLILGGNGFIGSHLAEGLLDDEFNVKIFSKFNNGTKNLDSIINKIELIIGNVFNENDMCHALKDVDIVLHYISATTPATAIQNPVYDIETNIVSSVKLIQNAVKNDVTKIIYASSGGTIYGNVENVPVSENHSTNPINPYSISKLAIEKYLSYFNYIHGLDYQILRYSNPYGERQNPNAKQGVIPIFLNNIKNGKRPIIYGDGSMIRDYIYIKDAIDATMAVLNKKTNENIFNIGSGKGTSLNELIEIISKVTGSRIAPKYVEKPVSYIPNVILDISRINKEVGWKPTTDITEGIRKTNLWINDNF